MASHLDNKILNSALLTADWLVNSQEKNGDFLLMTDSITGRKKVRDMMRSAYSGRALSLFGRHVDQIQYINCARKNLEFYKPYLANDTELNVEYDVFYCHLGLLALSLSDFQTASSCATKIIALKETGNYDFIFCQYALTFFYELFLF